MVAVYTQRSSCFSEYDKTIEISGKEMKNIEFFFK